MSGDGLGQIVVLNGAPRSGKSSIASIIQERFEGVWIALGVDTHIRSMIPPRLRPGIGLRPGGEAPELEALLPPLFFALYDSVAAHSRLGLNVVVDVGHHDHYSAPLHILPRCARRMAGYPVLFVGVRCDLKTILKRRAVAEPGREGQYLAGSNDEPVPPPVRLWQSAVHQPGIYDVEVNTSSASPSACAETIRQRLQGAAPTAFARLAAMSLPSI